MRRAIDLAFALFWLLVLWPVLLLIAVAIRLDSSGPILYTPKMIGLRGNVFSLLRFRTMCTQMDREPEQRLTRLGRLLRNYSLDHLPMLINLLKGDLTLVGPRPMEVGAVDMQDPSWQRYFQAKPGVFNYAVLKLGKAWTPARTRHPHLNQELELDYLQKRSARFDLYVVLDSLKAWIASKGNIKARREPDADVQDKLRSHLD